MMKSHVLLAFRVVKRPKAKLVGAPKIALISLELMNRI